MYRIAAELLLPVVVLLLAAPAKAQPALELVLVLDTTGSMSGLIERAKAELWGIVDQAPTQDVRLGLVAFRDRGDAYVTDVVDLSEDIDAAYARLLAFQANGGGDTPESVNQALADAVSQIRWTAGQGAQRVIILAGDAPPHMDYADEVPWPQTLRLARERDISVHAIQCGGSADTRKVWQAIAQAGSGTYAALASNPAHSTESPWDAQLAQLNRELAATLVPYGDVATRDRLRTTVEAARDSAAPAAAERASYLARRGKAATADDLLSKLAGGELDWNTLDELQLPDEVRELPADERYTFLQDQLDRRRGLLSEVAYYAEKRDAHLRAKQQPEKAFQREVVEALGWGHQ